MADAKSDSSSDMWRHDHDVIVLEEEVVRVCVVGDDDDLIQIPG